MEIDSGDTLFDLHQAIVRSVDFYEDHGFEFYAGRNRKNRKLRFDQSSPRKGSQSVYSGTTLEQVYPLPKSLRLFYHFDFGDNWYFGISRSRTRPTEPEPGLTYPRVVERMGPNPFQYGPPRED
jgi:hypothetical protein